MNSVLTFSPFLKGEMSKIHFFIKRLVLLGCLQISVFSTLNIVSKVPLANLHMPIVTDVGTCITHTKVNDMTDSQLPTPRALFFQSRFWNEAQNQLLLPNITDKSSPLPNQKSYRIKSNLSSPKILQKHQAYSRDRSIQTFLTRFPLTHDAFSSPSLSFSISQILTSFPHLPFKFHTFWQY